MSTCLVSDSGQKDQLHIYPNPPTPTHPCSCSGFSWESSWDALDAPGKLLFPCPLESSGSLRLAGMALTSHVGISGFPNSRPCWSVCLVSRCVASLARGPACQARGGNCLLGGWALGRLGYSPGYMGKDSKFCSEEFAFQTDSTWHLPAS